MNFKDINVISRLIFLELQVIEFNKQYQNFKDKF